MPQRTLSIYLFDSKFNFLFYLKSLRFVVRSVSRWALFNLVTLTPEPCFFVIETFRFVLTSIVQCGKWHDSLFRIDETFNLITIIDLCAGCFRCCRHHECPEFIVMCGFWIWCVQWKYKWKHFLFNFRFSHSFRPSS